MLKRFDSTSGSPFKRRTFHLRSSKNDARGSKGSTQTSASVNSRSDMEEAAFISDTNCTVLVINASQEMAKEITIQLTLRIPGCSIMYAPTISLAEWILARRPIDLVVSSPMLPDGNVDRLQDSLRNHESPPDVVVVGALHETKSKIFDQAGYKVSTYKRIRGTAQKAQPRKQAFGPSNSDDKADNFIKSLGADIRNDLNNPLQEIVAMVFVAKAGHESTESTNQALVAIEKAAKNMSQVVEGLEDKIREVVG